MTRTLNEATHTTQKRIWGRYYDLMEQFGVGDDDYHMAEFYAKDENEKVVGISQLFEFDKKEDRDALKAVFEGADEATFEGGVAMFDAQDAEDGDLPHTLRVTVLGGNTDAKKQAYARMDNLTEAASFAEPTAG